MNEVKIESGIPVPAFCRNQKYPWSKMKPGDSFFIAGKTAGATGGILATPRKKGFVMTVRSVTENGVHGARIWRVK